MQLLEGTEQTFCLDGERFRENKDNIERDKSIKEYLAKLTDVGP